MRRRNLALSVVVTVSLAELSGGGCDSTKGKGERVTQTKPDAKTKPDADVEPDAKAGPDADVEPDAKAGPDLGAPKTADIDDVPEPKHANPPPAKPGGAGLTVPTAVEASDPKKPEEKEPFPFPANVIKGDGATVMLQADGTCVKTKEAQCKPGKHCNPPKPKKIKCPKQLRLPRSKGSNEVYAIPNQTCWQRGTSKCAEGEACEPPPSTRVVCPKGIHKKK